MSNEELQPHLEFAKLPAELEVPDGQPPPSVVGAIGHFGNFELYARITQIAPGYTVATTYRGLPQQSLNQLLQKMREKSGCQFFERRFDGAKLKAAMNKPGTMLGLLADQDGGDRGLHIPFLGHDCSTSPAPAVFALRYNCPLYTAICYRVGLARWQVEIGQEIPTQEDGKPRSTEAIMCDVNRAFEKAVRRDPANWFWVHNRWKRGRPEATAASEKSTASAVLQDRHK
jgi:KDO2-lipid IV(A) lauroyltransferase